MVNDVNVKKEKKPQPAAKFGVDETTRRDGAVGGSGLQNFL